MHGPNCRESWVGLWGLHGSGEQQTACCARRAETVVWPLIRSQCYPGGTGHPGFSPWDPLAKLVCAEAEEDASLALSVAGQGGCSCEMIRSVV